MSTLSPQALKTIQNYLTLPFPSHQVICPYFNNRRVRLRGGLRALIGKGSPDDIVEEAMIISLREKIDLTKLSDEKLKKFLVDNKIGIDCSGLVYHILDAEMKARGKKSLHHVLKRPWFKNPIRKLLVKLRPIENTGVGTFNHEVNSVEISLKDVEAGDIIIMMGAGPKQDYNHILLVVSVVSNEVRDPFSVPLTKTSENADLKALKRDSSPMGFGITFVHSFQYPTDGLYNHGVRQESITVIDPNKNILEQNWSEPRMREYARGAKEVKVKRLFCNSEGAAATEESLS